jgi:hypothetical protein
MILEQVPYQHEWINVDIRMSKHALCYSLRPGWFLVISSV